MKDEKFFGFKENVVTTTLDMDENGMWLVSMKVLQGRREDKNAELLRKEYSCKVLDDNIEKALAKVSATLDIYLRTYNYDLFNDETLPLLKG